MAKRKRRYTYSCCWYCEDGKYKKRTILDRVRKKELHGIRHKSSEDALRDR